MSDSYIQQAFRRICQRAKQPRRWYVILAENAPYYGGPEEGGWWGEDHIVRSYQSFPTKALATAAKRHVDGLARELTEASRIAEGNHCLATWDWLEEHGLEPSFLPEPDGPAEFIVYLSRTVPNNRYGDRHYS